jgi:hypothetical protein
VNIADLFFMFRGTSDQLMLDAEKSGKAAGQKASASFGASFKKAVGGAIGAGLGAAFGIATAGALQLDAATRQLQADTGMTADEASRAQKALASMYRDNLQGFDEIGRAMAAVHNDLGLTGDEADRATRLFLRFATATGQNATEGVKAADDILDAWNLTAEDSERILDLLVASHQKYGGSIAENQKALSTLAPQLKALGVDIDGGIALLNLFEASGLDSSKAMFALNTAVKDLKPGESLDDLIARIAAIEDPTERAQAAIEVFGARGGVSLANALKPGMTGLADFAISGEDAAGAVNEAASAVESSFGNRFKLLLKNAGGALADFGTQFGGILMVASAFGPQLFTKMAAGIGGAVGLLGPRFAKALAPVFDKGMTMALTTLATSQGIARAMDGLGTFMGSTLGKATMVAFAAVVLVQLTQEYLRIKAEIDRLSNEVGRSAANQIATGTIEELRVGRAAIQKGIEDLELQAVLFGWMTPAAAEQAKLKEHLKAYDAAIAGQVKATTATVRQEAGVMRGVLVDEAPPAAGAVKKITTAFVDLKNTARTETPKVTQYFAWMVDDLVVEIGRAITDVFEPLNAEQRLIALNAETAAARRVLASKTASAAEKADARATIISLAEDTARQLTILAKTGQTNSTAYKTGMANLKTFSKDLGGAATTAGKKVEDLITDLGKLKQAAKNPIEIDVILKRLNTTGTGVQERAVGGPLDAGQLALVGEQGRELWIPETAGFVVDHATTERVLADGGGGGTTNITVALPVSPPPDPFRTADALRRLVDFGVLRPRTT